VRFAPASRWLGACCALAASPAAARAQVAATLDAGASYVQYDGFIGSGATSLTPSVQYRTSHASLGARGTVLVFESGNTSLEGVLTGDGFSPAVGAARLEVAGEAGASTYSSFAKFAHTIAQVRLHLMNARRGVWGGPLAGHIVTGSAGRAVHGVEGGLWVRTGAATLSATASRTEVGDTAFSDLDGRLGWRRGDWDVEGSIGTRFASRGGGEGGYGDLSATYQLIPRLGVVVAGGRYPSDPVRGSIPGSFFTVGFRVTAPGVAEERPVAVVWGVGAAALGGRPTPAGGAVLVVVQLDSLLVLTIRAPGAHRIELMGDFTDWQPVPLATAGDGRFQYGVHLAPGVYRFDVRLDGGPWIVPAGAESAPDEFGGRAGTLVVP